MVQCIVIAMVEKVAMQKEGKRVHMWMGCSSWAFGIMMRLLLLGH